jgi:predicted dehydrogenase
MNSSSRRQFIRRSALGTAALSFTPSTWAQATGSNSDIRVGVIGARQQGKSHFADAVKGSHGRRAVAVCDADTQVVDARVADAAKANVKVEGYQDYRKMLENKDIDAVVIATPNHLHTIIAIAAIQAGKHVYVEKPVSHNIHEGRRLADFAAKYPKLIVQHGMQRRTDAGWLAVKEFVASGAIGKPVVSRGFCYKKREDIGRVPGPQTPPSTVDYNLWCGPREQTPVMRKQFHYDWHWQWPFGNGDIGNQGPHQLDVARWLINDPMSCPERVISIGGRFGYEDDATTANTQIAFFDFKPVPVIFEVRGLPGQDMNYKGRMPFYKGGVQIGNVMECEGGYVAEGKAYDAAGKEMTKFKKDDGDGHRGYFFDAIRSGKIDTEHGALTGHLSAALAHMANHSYQLGKTTPVAELKSAIKDDALFSETFERMLTHLNDNKLEADRGKIVMGAALTLDPKTEKYTGNLADEANKLDAESYRAEFALPALA